MTIPSKLDRDDQWQRCKAFAAVHALDFAEALMRQNGIRAQDDYDKWLDGFKRRAA